MINLTPFALSFVLFFSFGCKEKRINVTYAEATPCPPRVIVTPPPVVYEPPVVAYSAPVYVSPPVIVIERPSYRPPMPPCRPPVVVVTPPRHEAPRVEIPRHYPEMPRVCPPMGRGHITPPSHDGRNFSPRRR